MEQNKFEKNIKESLENRTIVPSNDAWNKLVNKLDSEPEKSKFPTIYWVAASVVILMTISLLVFNKSSEAAPQVVETNVENKEIKNDVTIKTESVRQNKEVLVVEIDEKKELVIKKQPDLIDNKENVLVKNKIDTNTIKNKIERREIQVLTFEEKKINEVVDLIQTIQLERETTDKEVDSLLAQAQREIDSQKIFNKTYGKVDAMALLTDVESELDKSFKDKVLDILKDKVIQVVESKEN